METLILAVHLLVIIFMIIGFPIGLVLNNRKFRLFHAGSLAFITFLMILNIPCPLTTLEELYSGKSYEGSFIAFWLNKIVYMRWIEPKTVLIIDVGFALLVFSSFIWRPLNSRN
jgi:hypothetical protein